MRERIEIESESERKWEDFLWFFLVCSFFLCHLYESCMSLYKVCRKFLEGVLKKWTGSW